MLLRKWVFLLAAPLLAGMAMACNGGGGGSSQGIKIEASLPGAGGTPGAIPTLASAPTPVGSPASTDEVANLSANFGKVKSFRATVTQTGGTNNINGTIGYSAPDRIQVQVKNGPVTTEIICIGEAYYFKTGSAPWQRAPAGSPPCRVNLGPADPMQLADSMKKAAEDRTLNKGAQETIDGQRCQMYAQAAPNGASFEMCVANGLPVRLVSKDNAQTLTIQFSDYDKPIDIKAPI